MSATTSWPWVADEELVTLLPPRDALGVASNKVTDESTVVQILFCVLRLSLCVGSRRFTLHFTSLEIIIGIGAPTHNDLRRDSLAFYLNDLKIQYGCTTPINCEQILCLFAIVSKLNSFFEIIVYPLGKP